MDINILQDGYIKLNKKLKKEFLEATAKENLTRLLLISGCYSLFELWHVTKGPADAWGHFMATVPFNFATLNFITFFIAVLLYVRKVKLSGSLFHRMVSGYSLLLLLLTARISAEQGRVTGSITMFIMTMVVISSIFFRSTIVAILSNVAAYAWFRMSLLTKPLAGGLNPNVPRPSGPAGLGALPGGPASAEMLMPERVQMFLTDALRITLICSLLAIIVTRLRIKVFLEKKALKELALRDSMTELLNHRTILDALTKELNQSKRYSNPLSVLMIDIDHFKTINDTYGHQFGDTVIQQIAEIFREQCRETDHIGRYGGEEFLIVLTNTSEEDAGILAERLRKNIETNDFGIGKSITVSGGLKGYADETPEELISLADQALYKAKEEGRNRIIRLRCDMPEK